MAARKKSSKSADTYPRVVKFTRKKSTGKRKRSNPKAKAAFKKATDLIKSGKASTWGGALKAAWKEVG